MKNIFYVMKPIWNSCVLTFIETYLKPRRIYRKF
jgi:hypothetical protein